MSKIIQNPPSSNDLRRFIVQEVEGVKNGTYDYSQLKGDTGINKSLK